MSALSVRRILVTLLIVLSLGTPGLCKKAPEVNDDVEPTSFGDVHGRVYDAQTGLLIEGAFVSIQNDGKFAEKGKTTYTTNIYGAYGCEAKIGRVSSKGNSLAMVAALLLGGNAETGRETVRIDVTRLPVRITCEGYRTFEGIVPCWEADPESFYMTLRPVFLSRVDSDEVSAVAYPWGNCGLISIQADPAFGKPGDTVRLTAIVKCQSVKGGKYPNVACTMPGKTVMLKRSSESEGFVTYSASYTLPRSKTALVIPLTATLQDYLFDIFPGGTEKKTTLQVMLSDADQQTAELREQAYSASRAGDNVKSANALKELCATGKGMLDDFQMLAIVSERLHDYQSAADAYGHAVEMTPEKTYLSAVGEHARLLVLAGKQDVVLKDYLPLVEKVKPEKLLQEVPFNLMLAIGMAHLAAGDLDAADAMVQKLAGWPESNGNPYSVSLRTSLRKARVDAAIKVSPESASSWARYGRLLMDQGRWEEAVPKLLRSLELDPNQQALREDLDYAIARIQGESEVKVNLDEAIASARKTAMPTVGNKQEKSRDFFAWHNLGILLYRKYCEGNDPAVLAETRNVLLEGLLIGRQILDQQNVSEIGDIGYKKKTTINGFAYPEGDNDFLIFQSLRILGKSPDDCMALYNLASALCALGEYDLAKEPLDRCRGINPDFPEIKYLSALMVLEDSPETAKTLFLEVLAENPRHSEANITLARLLADEGDMTGAAAHLAAHAGYYGRPSQ
ncbi:MAG: tetratricopeptide repeat protein [Armatimonadota bacterium]